MRCCALNTGPDFHLLDHIGPLAYALRMPLFIEEEKNFTLIQHYYPMVDSVHLPEIEHNLRFFAENFDALFECKYWKPHLKRLFLDLYQKDMRLIFCAHGQSDKGYACPLLLPYSTQDACLIYGSLLKEMLDEMNISASCVYTGNYRANFYLENQQFYDALAEKEVFSRFPTRQQTLLYAPTWNDADGATSFFTSAATLCSFLPDDTNLIVKVHPLLEQRDPSQYYRIAHLIEQKPNRILVSEFTPVYPILAQCDAYLGDYSSVGYDFLYFQRPMFFLLNPKLPKGKIHECGIILEEIEDLFEQLKMNPLKNKQEELYNKAFNRPAEEVHKEFLSHLDFQR